MTRFVLLTDPQLGCRATFSGLGDAEIADLRARDMHVPHLPPEDGHEWDAGQLERAVARVNDLQPDFVVIAGDMVDDATSEDQYRDFTRLVEALTVPVHYVAGNHDAAFDGISPTHESLERYRDRFGPDHYAFRTPDAAFIALNTVILDHPEHVPDRVDQQLAFLRRELTRVVADPGPTVILGHHPLFLTDPSEPDTYWNIPFDRRSVMLTLIREHGVRAMFSGHYHRNNVANDGAFEMVTSGPVGFALGEDPPGYRVVEIDGGVLTHTYHPLPD